MKLCELAKLYTGNIEVHVHELSEDGYEFKEEDWHGDLFYNNDNRKVISFYSVNAFRIRVYVEEA